ncbi:MAG: DUF4179 domain-containing protein [Lawsonibacter sp.]|nr:DUF4179 domain-containing protein [Lawsonibacter sp.]
MTTQERYRAAFAGKAPRRAVDRALASLSELPKPRRRTFRPALAAAAAAALLTTGVSAEVNSAAVTNLLAPAFGSTRTQLLGDIGRPVGASVSADGYTLTAEAILGDRHNFVIAYTITREDGQSLPELCFFEGIRDNLRGSGSGYYWPADDDPTDNQTRYYQECSQGPTLPHTLKLSFSELVQYREVGEGKYEYTPLAEGPWELSFTCRYPDSSRALRANGSVFSDQQGHSYTISALSLSYLGFHLTGTTSPGCGEGPDDRQYSAYATLTDGSRVSFGNSSLHFHGSGSKVSFSWQGYFMGDSSAQQLISPDEVVSVTICDVTIPVM